MFLVSLFLTSCISSFFDKTVQAFEESTKEMKNANSDEEYNRIHDGLLRKLYDITLAYPNWQEIVAKEGYESSAVKEVEEAHKAYEEALREKVGVRFIFMTCSDFSGAISKFGGATSNDEVNSEEEEKDEISTETSDASNIDEYLTSYEEYCNECIDLIKKAASGDLEALPKSSELQSKAEELADKMDNLKDEMTSEQLSRFEEIQQRLKQALLEK